MRRTRSVFDDSELVMMLKDEPELLAIADALVVTLRPEYAMPRRAPVRSRRTRRLVALGAALAAVVALLLAAPWQRGPSLVENALAAIGDAPVLHVVVERPTPNTSLRELATGAVVPRIQRTEIWFDGERDLKKTVTTLDGAVLDEVLETSQGGWTRGGRVYTCAWIAAHPVEATKAGVSCNPSGENGTTPRNVPEQPPTVDLALGGFVDRYRAALATGAAARVGEGAVDGRDVVWLRIPTPTGAERVALDAATYKPVRIESENGRVIVQVALAESVPFDAARFTQRRHRALAVDDGGAVGANVSAEAEIAPSEAAAALGGQALWLGPEWSDLTLTGVTRQTRTIRSATGGPAETTTVELTYEPADASRSDTNRQAIRVYESTVCLVRLGWTCTARDPDSASTVGLPFGTEGFIALLRHGDLYVSIWRSAGSGSPSLLDAARAVRPVGS